VPQQPQVQQQAPAVPAAPRLVVPATPPVGQSYAAPQTQGYAPPQQGYAPAQAARPGYGQPYYGPQQTSGLAIASLILALIGTFPLSIILGHIARGQIKRDPTQKGAGIALAGLIISYTVVIASIILVLLIIFGLFAFGKHSNSMTRDLKKGQGVAQALHVYANENGGDYPVSLDELVPDLLTSDDLLCRNDDGDMVRFKYFTGHDPYSRAGYLVASPEPVNGERIVVTVSGSGYVVSESEYQSKLKEFKKAGVQ